MDRNHIFCSLFLNSFNHPTLSAPLALILLTCNPQSEAAELQSGVTPGHCAALYYTVVPTPIALCYVDSMSILVKK